MANVSRRDFLKKLRDGAAGLGLIAVMPKLIEPKPEEIVEQMVEQTFVSGLTYGSSFCITGGGPYAEEFDEKGFSLYWPDEG